MAKHLVQPDTLPAIREGLSKRQIAELADNSVEVLLEDGNVFQVAEALASMEEFVKAVRKDERYINFLRDELAKHHGRLVTTSGAKIELCEAGVSYDYSGNGEWRELEAARFEIERQKKALEEKLRLLSPGRVAVDPETGEMLEGPLKSSKSTYRITLAK
ncbi:hypothetical protein [Flavisolibacter nicotianae]|uniref:hypothetical protein n=1 Tax=Flavisolibacter nicotianae TaxID=2364882 RepID=UPI0013C4852D|nr:hypothetical protein [Flavisolibacter nicotianae]